MKTFLEILYHTFGSIVTWLFINYYAIPFTKEQTILFFIGYFTTFILLKIIKPIFSSSKRKILVENGETELDYVNPKQINSKRRKHGNL